MVSKKLNKSVRRQIATNNTLTCRKLTVSRGRPKTCETRNFASSRLSALGEVSPIGVIFLSLKSDVRYLL